MVKSTRIGCALAVSALMVGVGGAARAHHVIDHYKVYNVADDDPIGVSNVNVSDQFGSSLLALQGVNFLANPVAKQIAPGIPNFPGQLFYPDEHLNWYFISPQEPQPPRSIRVDNQFGEQSVDLGDAIFVLLPAIKDNEISNGGIILNQHFKCYQAAGAPPGVTVNLQDQFGVMNGVEVGPPSIFCNPAEKTPSGDPGTPSGPPIYPGEHLTCYDTPMPVAPTAHTFVDQFAPHSGQVFDVQWLCVPSYKIIGAPTLDRSGMVALVGMMAMVGAAGWWVSRRRGVVA